jgi:DNA-binding IclR family transcriptional regulator
MQNLTEQNASDRHFVTALARGLQVLSVFRPQDRVLGNQELARRSTLPKSTVSRLTYTLTRLGYLEQVHDARGAPGYRLGSRVLALGSTLLQGLDVRALARPLMQELANDTRTMVALGTPDRRSMIYIETCRDEATLTLRLNVGSRIPMAATAMGRAYLAICSAKERDALAQHLQSRHPADWPKLEAGLRHALETHASHGCCTSFAEWQGEVNAIAVAFRMPGQPPMAVSCGGPVVSVPADYLMQEVRPRMLAMVERLQAMG